MKYVKTKNSIREIINDYGNCCSVKSNHGKTIDGFTIIYGLAFAPRADTVEELCDEYCLKGSDGTRLVYNRSDFADLKKGILSNNGWTEIYGAIWTERGLKYIAKMNKKGELKLI